MNKLRVGKAVLVYVVRAGTHLVYGVDPVFLPGWRDLNRKTKTEQLLFRARMD